MTNFRIKVKNGKYKEVDKIEVQVLVNFMEKV